MVFQFLKKTKMDFLMMLPTKWPKEEKLRARVASKEVNLRTRMVKKRNQIPIHNLIQLIPQLPNNQANLLKPHSSHMEPVRTCNLPCLVKWEETDTLRV